jgi:alanyl-tRNA synthetase
VADAPVRALTTSLDEAKRLGAMALFGEKYGDVVRMVEVGDGGWSRELCGGTHARSTGVIGAFKVTTETSSAANVRRIEAVTSRVALDLLRERDRQLEEAARVLRTAPEHVAEVAADRERKRRELEKAAVKPVDDRLDTDAVVDLDGVRVLLDIREVSSPKALPDLADRFKNQLGDPAVVVLGAPGDGRASLIVAATPGAVERGVKAGTVVKAAAAVVGGGGGGRDTMAQAGGRDPDKLPQALDAAREAIAAAIGA